MPYVTDQTIEPLSSQSIFGYRSGVKGDPLPKNADSCDKKFTLQNPFDFSIDWRIRYVKVKVKRTSNNGRIYVYYTWKPVTYPYYQFKKQTRTLREWRLIYKAGSKVVAEYQKGFDVPHVAERLSRLKTLLDTQKGGCKKLGFKRPGVQHTCISMLSTASNFPVGPYEVTAQTADFTSTANIGNFAYYAYRYRFWEPLPISYAGESFNTQQTVAQQTFTSQLTDGLVNTPIDIVSDLGVASTLTAMLWPDSSDFEDIESSPLIDAAEALSDSKFPLGDIPSPTDAYERMKENAIPDSALQTLMGSGKEAIDFAANSWLWATLVIEPVVSSAIGLSASVQANDDAIDAYSEAAKDGKWIQGKNLRFIKNAADCSGVSLEYSESKIKYNSDGYTNGHAEIDVSVDLKKAEANASFYYKLSELDAAQMNTSGARIGQFLNRMSSSFEQVAYNIIPLSFVFDWFSSEFSGILNLKNKIYLPVDDWKLVTSYNLDAYVLVDDSATLIYSTYDQYARCRFYNPPSLVGIIDWTTRPDYSYGLYCYKKTGEFPNTLKQSVSERVRYYNRFVFDRPSRRTDFSTGIDIPCFNNNPGEISTGQSVTLGALIWSFLT